MCDSIDSGANDISKLKVAELKKELKSRGLSTTGNKNELAERLKEALTKNDLDLSDHQNILGDSVLLDEDVLNDDDVLDDKDEEIASITDTKDTLKRTHSVLEGEIAENDAKEVKVAEPEVDTLLKNETKKVIKLGSYSDKERLEMRAKKFGTPLTSEMKKEVRAARFGLNANTKSQPTNKKETLEVLKKRAERFGGSVSELLTEAETKEKLEKRKERFKPIQISNDSITKSTVQVNTKLMSNAERAQMRLKRFNMGVK